MSKYLGLRIKQTIYYASKKTYFFNLLCNFSIPGNHGNHVIMNPDRFCLRIKLSYYVFRQYSCLKVYKKFDL